MKNQPKALLGLYAYVKKVTVPSGSSFSIDGTSLLKALPDTLPASLQGSRAALEWYPGGKAAGSELEDPATSARRREIYYTTTVSNGIAIHINCHSKARTADRNHPKAPKSEWEGASLRNSRVKCNVILPLVNARSSSVSLATVEQALTDHQTAVANLLGVRPRSNLWTVLHDVRFLLLRIAYGEALNGDCGGGSLKTNAQLVFYQLSMARTFESEAQIDSPTSSLHANELSSGFLAAREIVTAKDCYGLAKSPTFLRAIADSAVMAALTCVLFEKNDTQSKRRWVVGKEHFLRGLLNCAGSRHASGIHDSGCLSRTGGTVRSRSSSFTDWEVVDSTEDLNNHGSPTTNTKSGSSSHASIDDFANALRPFIVFYAMMDQLSLDFTPTLDDEAVEEAATRLAEVIETCQKSKDIHELLEKAKVTLSHSEIMNELQRGMMGAAVSV
jgi:hypothetical protein